MRTVLFVAFTLGILAATSAPTVAHADAVPACMPGYQSTHHGCVFSPGPEDLLICSAAAALLVAIGGVGALALRRRTRESGPREGP